MLRYGQWIDACTVYVIKKNNGFDKCHLTLIQGLYPENHGIVENSMYDHDKDEEFYLGSPNTFHPFWWQGEPVSKTM